MDNISFIVTADLQLNKTYTHSKNIPTTLLGFEGLWNLRLIDRVANFKKAVDKAVAAKVDFFVIAGDIFDKFNPPEEIKALFIRMIEPLIAANIKLFLIIGNHDTDGKSYNLAGESELIELIQQSKSIVIVDKPWKYEKGDFKLLMLPWMAVEDVNQYMQKIGNNFLVFGHLPVNGAVLGAHEFLEEHAINPIVFKNQKMVYLGHYHRHQKIEKNIYYVGSIARQDMGERTEEKGYMYCTLKNGEMDNKFVSVEDRPFLLWEITEGGVDIYDKFEKEGDLNGAVIKIKFIGSNIWYHSIDKKRVLHTAVDNSAVKVFIEWIDSKKIQFREPEVTIESEFEEGIKHLVKKENKEEWLKTGLKILAEVQDLP